MRAVAVLVGISLSVQVPTRAQSAPTWIAADQGTHIDVVARFTGSEWVPMPSAGPGRAVPRDWTRWYTLGASIPIRLSSTEPAGRCSAPKRLPIANPPSRTVGRADARYVGLAVSGPIQIEPMTRVTDTSPEWERIASAVAPVFERHARDNGVAPGTLDRVPLTIDWVYGIGRGSERATIYFEASKRVPDAGNTPEEDPKGVVRVAVSGWLGAAGERFIPAGTKGELHWEPADERPGSRLPGMLPLGVLRRGNERIWVMMGQTGVRNTFHAVLAGCVERAHLVDG